MSIPEEGSSTVTISIKPNLTLFWSFCHQLFEHLAFSLTHIAIYFYTEEKAKGIPLFPFIFFHHEKRNLERHFSWEEKALCSREMTDIEVSYDLGPLTDIFWATASWPLVLFISQKACLFMDRVNVICDNKTLSSATSRTERVTVWKYTV